MGWILEPPKERDFLQSMVKHFSGNGIFPKNILTLINSLETSSANSMIPISFIGLKIQVALNTLDANKLF